MAPINAARHSQEDTLPEQLYMRVPEFILENGAVLYDAVVAFTFKGMLNAARDNAVLVCHPAETSSNFEDWWPSLTVASPVVDPRRYCIICCNSLGSPYGSSSPLSHRPRSPSGFAPYGQSFPQSTVLDDVRIHKYVLDVLGVRSICCVIGRGMMGGMLALEWASFGQDYVRNLAIIGAPARYDVVTQPPGPPMTYVISWKGNSSTLGEKALVERLDCSLANLCFRNLLDKMVLYSATTPSAYLAPGESEEARSRVFTEMDCVDDELRMFLQQISI